ncbi:Pre-mRNA-splicing factor [Phytophthora cactorum]|uniref:Pre-mRNA-splicing factor n=1 Tax=Phytophthora cactorum TaxID=29920 RepID=A0A8T0Y6T2_9STRA|nr:Pre-mRNA-splicing factor [Phytophthora cactorum]KAG2958059.1 Pre-mRNA-splicing factor [Phytophthora cactorum]KAG3053353.1 Pre-mRNA-splicing factor [Phytophthora cactorum]KAG3131204.1 Pre-mRNA-splicing factor [Phytophthora cactorum]
MARSPSRSHSRSRRHRSRRRARSASTSSSALSSRSRSRSSYRSASPPPRKKSRRKSRTDEDDAKPAPRTRDDVSGDVTPPRRSKDDVADATPPRRPLKQDVKKENPADTKPVRKRTLLVDARASGRTGGVYIPPFKLAQLRQQQEKDLGPSSEEMQRRTWDALRKSLNGLINKVNVANLSNILPELFQENLVRARGLLVRAIMKAQLASPGFTHIYAALVAVINTKMPENGELLVKRVIFRFRRAFKRGDKVVAIALVRFIAHLVNQQVVHELLALEVLTLLLANPTDDSVEVAVNFTKECGQILAELCPEGLRAIFERFRGILHEGEIDKRVQYTIEGLFAIRKGGFADYPAVHEQLDLVESGDQITHEATLEGTIDCEDKLDVFRFDSDYEKNEHMWAKIKQEILGESVSDVDSSSGSDDDGDEDEEDEPEQPVPADNNMAIQDFTEQDLVNLRRTIYLTIMSSITHEECAHKLMKLNIRPGQEKEICSMLIECCSQERTYLRYYGLLSERFCLIKREYQDAFDECFAEQYSLIHRLETNKLRNVAKLFAHLLFTDALPWTVFEYIHLNEEETTSSSRIFIKILCQELSEHLGMKTLKERFLDELMQPTFAGLFPKDNPRNTRFAINFFTSIGLVATRTPTRATAAVAAAVLQIRTPIPVTAAAIRPIPTKLETGSSEFVFAVLSVQTPKNTELPGWSRLLVFIITPFLFCCWHSAAAQMKLLMSGDSTRKLTAPPESLGCLACHEVQVECSSW